MIYEIINPSDPYTLEADDFKVACVATCVLGTGAWGLQGIDNDSEMPIFIMGGADEWFTKQFGLDFAAALESVPLETLASVLDGVLIGQADNRQLYHDGLALMETEAKRAQWRELWHDKDRTSLNDIGRRAWALAEAIRQKDTP